MICTPAELYCYSRSACERKDSVINIDSWLWLTEVEIHTFFLQIKARKESLISNLYNYDIENIMIKFDQDSIKRSHILKCRNHAKSTAWKDIFYAVSLFVLEDFSDL